MEKVAHLFWGRLVSKASDSQSQANWQASYADFVIVGLLRFFKVIDEDIYKKVILVDPSLGRLYDASEPWLKRDDH